jgi:tRNA1(Val) A37 N6-methylase TrmN6
MLVIYREKVMDNNSVKIIVENPPYFKSGSGGSQKTGRKENKWKKSFVCKEIKRKLRA